MSKLSEEIEEVEKSSTPDLCSVEHNEVARETPNAVEKTESPVENSDLRSFDQLQSIVILEYPASGPTATELSSAASETGSHVISGLETETISTEK